MREIINRLYAHTGLWCVVLGVCSYWKQSLLNYYNNKYSQIFLAVDKLEAFTLYTHVKVAEFENKVYKALKVIIIICFLFLFISINSISKMFFKSINVSVIGAIRFEFQLSILGLIIINTIRTYIKNNQTNRICVFKAAGNVLLIYYCVLSVVLFVFHFYIHTYININMFYISLKSTCHI